MELEQEGVKKAQMSTMECKEDAKKWFWEDVLGSPKFIAAPMVDMSELPFRMLCRRYGTQVCYSPMFHARQFLKDENYRKTVFTTCDEDRPLIVQFCANDKETFFKAAQLVEPLCDAVDLNLGCPQIIAKRGHYGSFLQEEWDLVSDIIHYSSQRLSIPVTCKIRILPDIERSIRYAQTLELAGAKLLTVHGRTRDMKGPKTGLADWNAIKAIKEKLTIPVVANGNILSYGDVHDCLAYTGADAVMSAEAILQNPALFSGRNHPVWDMATEFLELCKKYPISYRHVKTHLFRIFSKCICQHSELQEQLAEADTLDKLTTVTQRLKHQLLLTINASHSTDSSTAVMNDAQTCDACFSKEKSQQIENQTQALEYLIVCTCECQQQICTINRYKAIDTSEEISLDLADGKNHLSDEFSCMTLTKLSSKQEVGEVKCNVDSKDMAAKYSLPDWICHSRPRQMAAQNSSSEEINQGSFTSDEETDNHTTNDAACPSKTHMTKSEKKKKMFQLRIKGMKAKRQKKREEKRQRKLEQSMLGTEIKIQHDDSSERLTKKQRQRLMKERCLAAMTTGQRVCIDLSLEIFMSEKECSKLAQQLCRLYGYNHQATNPMHLYFTGFKQDGVLYKECLRKNAGFQEYMVDMTEESHMTIFSKHEIIYLSPDSPNVLTGLNKENVYVIGGLVDESVSKNLTHTEADKSCIRTARLPIDEFMTRAEKGTFNRILAVNQVFDILLEYSQSGNWGKALLKGIPARKGFIIKNPGSQETEEH